MTEHFAIPDRTHWVYRELVLGERQVNLKCLALKILLGRIQMSAMADRSPDNVQKQIGYLHSFFCMNEALARRDLEAIFKGVEL